MSSVTSSKRFADRIRWRHIVDAADPARIRALVASAGVFSPEEIDIAGALAQTTLDKSETYRFLFAERGGDLLGYTCFDRIPLSSVSFDLYWIAVAPKERGSGLARQLLERTASVIRSKRGIQLFAETSSRDIYAAARAFYLKSGFEEAARFEDFYAVGDAKLVFRMKL